MTRAPRFLRYHDPRPSLWVLVFVWFVAGVIAGFWMSAATGCSKAAPHVDPTREEFANADVAQRGAGVHAVAALGQKSYGPTHGTSMEPLIYAGDFVVLQERAFSEVREGKVYGYLPKPGEDFPSLPTDYNSRPIHRAVQNTKDGWIMAGDSAPRSDSSVRMTAQNMVGELIYVAHVKR